MLAIGLVVDDAIVVLENVYRHMEMGKTRRQAAIDGLKEIGFAVLATTISLVAVFVPLAFLQGIGGAAVQRIRIDGGGGGADLGVCGADADADALFADAEAAARGGNIGPRGRSTRSSSGWIGRIARTLGIVRK